MSEEKLEQQAEEKTLENMPVEDYIVMRRTGQEPEKKQAEYDAGWDEAGKAPEGHKEGEKEPGQGEGLPEKEAPPAGESEAKEPPAEDSKEKALRDTKAWATKLAMENAELKKTVEAFKKGEASAKDVKDAQQAAAKAQDDLNKVKEKVYEDYPELKDLLDPMLERSSALEKEISDLKADRAEKTERQKYQEALDDFNANIKPEILKVHPDFDDILFKTMDGKRASNDEYFQWAEKQSPAMRFAAMQSSAPQDIIMAVTAYKKFKASDEARDLKVRQEKEKKQKIINAMSLRGGGSPMPAGPKASEVERLDAMPVDEYIAMRRKK